MDKKQIERYINEYIERLHNRITLQNVILYGSFVVGGYAEGSDVDMIVVSDQFRTMDEDERLDLLYRMTVHIPLDFHIYGFTPEELEHVSPLNSLHSALQTGVSFIQ